MVEDWRYFRRDGTECPVSDILMGHRFPVWDFHLDLARSNEDKKLRILNFGKLCGEIMVGCNDATRDCSEPSGDMLVEVRSQPLEDKRRSGTHAWYDGIHLSGLNKADHPP